MSRWAHVRAGVVVAVSEGLTPPVDAASTLIACGDTVQETDTYDGSVFAAGPRPLPPVPSSVTMRQGREMLIRMGLDEAVEAAIDAIVDPIARKIARNAWEKSNDLERHNGLVVQIAPVLGLSDAQVDALFRAAARL